MHTTRRGDRASLRSGALIGRAVCWPAALHRGRADDGRWRGMASSLSQQAGATQAGADLLQRLLAARGRCMCRGDGHGGRALNHSPAVSNCGTAVCGRYFSVWCLSSASGLPQQHHSGPARRQPAASWPLLHRQKRLLPAVLSRCQPAVIRQQRLCSPRCVPLPIHRRREPRPISGAPRALFDMARRVFHTFAAAFDHAQNRQAGSWTNPSACSPK
ncbi:hypothetical protein BCR34DRAFT_660503 [Clohesyomyces aquaticus]|uniref:Uncharacterized protein n=1 Tax=Clohesyomyces aquaticus TaxID=1231657 RepID=A0A1Y2A5X3_9PLEO|nr:hypothetical protein BCR34DRAFT_660503 [Clohesyomyces aquaticus]